MSVEMNPVNWYSMDKQAKYDQLNVQITAVIDPTVDATANLANVSALLKEAFGWWWIGFYRVQGNQLILGPFQGPVACTRIAFGKGVCGSSWKAEQTLVVPNVDEFSGHIACSSYSRSEIVVPIRSQNGQIWGVLDADSEYLNHFDSIDQFELEKICRTLTSILS
jgi:GAF domain-containing protein